MTLTLATTGTIQGVAGSATAITYTIFGDEISTTPTNTFKKLAQGQLPAAAAAIYTVPASTSTIINAISLVNTTAGAVTVVLFADGTAAANRIVNLTVPANGFAAYDANGWKVFDATGQQLFVGATGATGATGSTGPAGSNGTNGTNGWSPTLAVVSNGSSGFVFQIVGWVGGTGTPPSSTNQFIGSSGIVGTAAAAQDIRGTAGIGVPVGGRIGQSLVKTSNTDYITGWSGSEVFLGRVTAASKSYALADNLGYYERINGGAAMTDTLPTLTAADNGFRVGVHNKGTAIAETITFTGAGGEVIGDVATSYVLQYACRQTFVWTGTKWLFGAGNANLTKSPTVAPAAGDFATYTDTTGRQLTSVTLAATKTALGLTGTNSGDQNVFSTVTGNTGTANADTATDTIAITGAAPISTAATDTPDGLVVSIAAATTTTAGSLSAAGFKKLAGYQDMVADWGFVGDGTTDNLAAWNTFKGAVANNSNCYFPPGTYKFTGEATLDQDKHLQFYGAGEYVSILSTSSTTANLINVTGSGGNAWYNTFTDLGFASSVTKTAGAHLAFNVAAAIGCDVRRCAFSGHFIGLDFQGAQAGNVTMIDTVSIATPAVNGRGIRINGNTINMIIADSTINSGPTTFAVAGSANVEINQSGAVQILGCDFIGGINSLLLNANQGGGSSIASVYVTNTFFDQSGGSTVKITGANTTNRVKFTQCGIAAGAIGTHAFEVAGTGAGAVGSATALPAGISLVDCDIYYAPGSSTAAGIRINGCQDINIQSTRITGFSGTGGAAINCTPTSVTELRINGCILGPNSNLTIPNATGIVVAAATVGRLSISDNTIKGYTVKAIDDLSTVTYAFQKAINNNDGQLRQGVNNTALSNQAIAAATATYITGSAIPIPFNAIAAGSVLQWKVTGTTTAAAGVAANTINVRIGAAGTVADTVHQAFTTAVGTATTGINFEFIVTLVFAAPGATANSRGVCNITNSTAATGFINIPAQVITLDGTAFNSAAAGVLFAGLSLTTGAAKTVSIQEVVASVLQP